MKTTTRVCTLIPILIFTLVFFSHAQEKPKPWPTPETSKKMKNPLKADKEIIAEGKILYAKHCQSCHGKKGEGDGTKAAELKTFPGDFTSQEFHIQSDGEIFYKVTEGREDMPSYKKKIASDEDRWAIISYIRTFDSAGN